MFSCFFSFLFSSSFLPALSGSGNQLCQSFSDKVSKIYQLKKFGLSKPLPALERRGNRMKKIVLKRIKKKCGNKYIPQNPYKIKGFAVSFFAFGKNLVGKI